MRKLVYFVATSMDGFMAGPDGQFDFFPMEGDHVAAQAAELAETLPRHVREALGVSLGETRFDTVLMGRGTYEPGLAAGFEDPYAPLRTVVFSRRLPAREGRLQITAEEPLRVVRELKQQAGKDLWLCGGGALAGQLLDEIDELVIKVNPVLALDGIRVLQGSFQPRKLTLRHRRAFESGVTWLYYDVAPRAD
jgi:dihydrofolate reductase